MSARVGRDVEAACRKCGEVWHVVIALTEGRIAKVECKECGARHRYRPVAGAPAVPRVRATSASSRATRPRKIEKPVVAADPSRPPRPFRTTDTYQVGDRVVHASFGEGVVQAVRTPKKIEILFASGPKVLVQGRG